MNKQDLCFWSLIRGALLHAIEVYSPDPAPSDITIWDECMQDDRFKRPRPLNNDDTEIRNEPTYVRKPKGHITDVPSPKSRGQDLVAMN